MSREPCPDCDSSSGFQDFGDHTYCFKCGRYKVQKMDTALSLFDYMEAVPNLQPAFGVFLPSDITSALPQEAKTWLLKAGIGLTKARAFGIGYSAQLARVILPISMNGELVAYQARGFDPEAPKYFHIGRKNDVLFEGNIVVGNKTVVLTEDILSAIRVGDVRQDLDVLSLLGTKISEINLLTLSRKYEKIILWLDPDQPGQQAMEHLMKKLPLYVKTVEQITSERDPKCYFNQEIENILKHI